MTFDDMVHGLGEAIGSEVEAERDFCAIEVGDEAMRTVVLVHYAEGEQVVFMSADLGEPPPERMEGLYRTMLEANCDFGMTGGSTLGIDPETGHVRIERYDTLARLADKGPFAVFEKFVLAALEWRRIVSEYRETAELGNASESEDHAEMPVSEAGFMHV